MADPIYIGLSLGPSGGGMYYDPASGLTWTADTGWYDAGPQGGGGGAGGTAPGGTAPGGTAPGTTSTSGGGTSSGGGGGYSGSGSTGGMGGTRYQIRTSDGSDGFPAGTTYQIDTYDGSISSIRYPTAQPSGNYPGDANGDGLQDDTGLANGVVKVALSVSPTGYLYGSTPVWPNGAPYQGNGTTGSSGPQYVTKTSDGSDGFPPGTIYQLNTQTGQRSNIRYPSTSSGSSGGSSGGGGGGSSSSSVHSGGYNNTTTDIRSGGYNNTNTNINQSTSFNTSDIGPNTIANNAADRAQQAAQFAQTFGLNQQKQRADLARQYAELLGVTDPSAFGDFLREGGGDLQNAIGTGHNAISQRALAPAAETLALLRGQEGGLPTGGATGGGTAGNGGGGASPGGTGGGGTTPSGGAGSPATTPPAEPPPAPPPDPYTAQYGTPPEGYGSWQDWATQNVPGLGQGKGAVDFTDPVIQQMVGNWIRNSQIQNAIQNSPRAQQTINQMAAGWPVQVLSPEVRYARYMANVPGSAQWNNNLKPWEAGYQPMQTPGGYIGGGQYAPAATTTVNTGGDTAQNPGYNVISPQPTNPAPTSNVQIAGGLPTNTTPLGPSTNPTTPFDPNAGSGFHAGDPNYKYEPSTGTYVHLAYGGVTRAPMMVTGDPQRDGMPNPEIISNPTGAPISVMPMRNMGGLRAPQQHMMPDGRMMAGPPMGGMPQPNAMAMTHANDRARFMRRMGGLPRFAYGTDGIYDRSLYDTAAPTPTSDGSVTQRELLYSTPPATTTAAAPTADTAPTATRTSTEPTTSTTYGGLTTGGATTTVTASPPTYADRATYVPPTSAPAPTDYFTRTPAPQPAPSTPPTTLPANPMAPNTGNPYYDQVLADRLAAQLPAWAQGNPYAFMLTNYDQMDPVERQLYEQYLQTAKGIPIASTQFQAARNRLGGLSRGNIAIGY